MRKNTSHGTMILIAETSYDTVIPESVQALFCYSVESEDESGEPIIETVIPTWRQINDYQGNPHLRRKIGEDIYYIVEVWQLSDWKSERSRVKELWSEIDGDYHCVLLEPWEVNELTEPEFDDEI